MLDKPSTCDGCPLVNISQGFSEPEGTGSIPLLIVGESLGYNEALDGLPFRPSAQAGSVLHRIIQEKAKFNRSQFAFWNLCACHPPSDKLGGASYEYEAINHCRVHFDRVIDKFRPKVMLACGALPFRHLVGLTGKGLNIEKIRGYVFRSSRYPDVLVVPTFHPSFIRRGNAHLIGVLLYDFMKAVRIAQGKEVSFILDPFQDSSLEYNTSPTLEDALNFLAMIKASPSLRIGYDIETDKSIGEEEDELEDKGYGQTITQIQFSVGSSSGIAFRWMEPFITISRDILSTPNPKLGHNCFSRNTSVWMADGRWKPIWTIDIGEKVRSVDEDGWIVEREVEGIYHTKDDRPWVKVKVDGSHNRGTGRWNAPEVVCTPDHEWILINGCKKRADELQEGDELYIPRYGNYDLIFGTLLGDGHADRTRDYLKITHTNQEWAEYKALNLGVELYDVSVEGFSSTQGWELCARIPHYWRETFYPNDIRTWHPPSLKALAVWYCDDGCLGTHENFSMSLHSFEGQLEEIRSWFTDRFGLSKEEVKLDGLNLRVWKEPSKTIFKAIEEYIPPCMEYKLPLDFQGMYNRWLEDPIPQIGRVISIAPATISPKLDKHKFCLEIEDTHTFFTRAGLVSNCWDFDNPYLNRSGININGRIDDSMWMFHHWQADLSRGLQGVASFYNFPFPWKHYANSNQAFYGIADVTSLHYIYDALKKQLEERDLWNGYERLVHNLKPVLIRVQDRGLPINKEKQDKFRGEIEDRQGEIEEGFKGLPLEFTTYHPTNGYVREPKEIKGLIQRLFVQNGTEPTEAEVEEWALPMGLIKRKFPVVIEGNEIGMVRWCKPLYFNPNSADQVSNFIKYRGDEALARKLAVKIVKEERKKDENGTSGKENVMTGKGILKTLASKTGDKTYSYIIEYRELTKMSGTFLWEPDGDGRVHTTFGFGTGSGQLTSRDPNIQQGPEHYLLAEKFKETIEAGEGKLLLKVDYRAYHASMLAFLAEDEAYLRLSRIDPHSYVTAHMLALPGAKECYHYSNKDLEEYLAKVKKEHKGIRDDQAKHAILGIGFGLSEKGCYDRYREDFNPSPELILASWGTRKKKKPSDINPKTGSTFLQEEIEKQGKIKVRNLYLLLRQLFPKIFKYHEKVLIEASQKGYLDTPFGFRRWFPGASEPVYDKWGNILSIKKGEQAEEALAFPVSNNAHCHLREGVLMADAEGILDRLRMVNWVHDDLRFEVDQEGFEEDLMKLLTILERESTILHSKLGWFSCKADVQIGKNLAQLKKWTLS